MKKGKCWLAFLLILALLFGGCQTNVPVTTELSDTTPPDTTGVEPVTHTWSLTEDWTVALEDGSEVLTAPGGENAVAINGAVTLETSWEVAVTVDTGKSDCARILLAKSSGDVLLAAGIRFEGGKARLTVDQWDNGAWKNLGTGEEFFMDAGQSAVLKAWHYEGLENIQVALVQNGEKLSSLKCKEVTLRMLGMLAMTGVGADGNAVFTDFTAGLAVKPETPVDQLLRTMEPGDQGFYLALAEIAEQDVITNFWTGDNQTGKFLPTWIGLSENLGDERGNLWETAMLVFGLYDLWRLTGDAYYYELLAAEAKFFREDFTEQELENAGGLFLWWSDDCAWNALLYLCFYSVTGDTWFVDRAIGLLDNVNERWYDEELNGILYKDGVDYMSSYEVGIAWSWLQLWEITGEQRFYDLALRSYEGMHSRLGRDDGLYFVEANTRWPIGEKDNIHEAGSSSYLSGNLGMAALSAKFYRLTGEQEYLDRVYKTNEGLLKYYDNDGVLLNDRDAWTNGTYAGFYASEVLLLPNTEEMQQLLKNTALSIVTNARTEDGYYGGSWSGPAEGSGSVWHSGGSIAQQSCTTGTSVLIVTAAAILEAGIEHYTR